MAITQSSIELCARTWHLRDDDDPRVDAMSIDEHRFLIDWDRGRVYSANIFSVADAPRPPPSKRCGAAFRARRLRGTRQGIPGSHTQFHHRADPLPTNTAHADRPSAQPAARNRNAGHHAGKFRARLGVVKALRFASTRERAHGLDDALGRAQEWRLRDGRPRIGHQRVSRCARGRPLPADG